MRRPLLQSILNTIIVASIVITDVSCVFADDIYHDYSEAVIEELGAAPVYEADGFANRSEYSIDYDVQLEELDNSIEDWMFEDEPLVHNQDNVADIDGDVNNIADHEDIEAISEAESVTSGQGELNIYGIYLGDDYGDSTLVESNGEYLLIDIGQYKSYPYVKAFLDSKGVTKLSLYYSHLHGDHNGGLSAISTGSNCGYDNLLHDYDVTAVYLPEPGIVTEVDYSTKYTKIKKLYDKRGYEGRNSENSIVYLKAGSSFTFGDATVKVIGPIDYDDITIQSFLDRGFSQDDAQNGYINNRSLVSQITCGSTTFLTCGDCSSEEESKLIKAYGDNLKADIYKLSHHGISSSNTKPFIDKVRASYAYGMDSGKMTGMDDSGKRLTWASQYSAKQYGIVYMVGQEKEPVTIHSGADGIKMYRGNGSSDYLKGLVQLSGGTGLYYFPANYNDIYDYYLLDDNGVPMSGVQNYNGKNGYYLRGGCRLMSYFVGGSYSPVGLLQGNDGRYEYRYIDIDGTLAVNEPKLFSGSYYYFGSDGALVRNKKVKINGVTYNCGDGGKIDLKYPGKSSIVKTTPGRDKFKIEWKKTGRTDGYEIYVATSKKGKYKKVATVKKATTTKKIISKLEPGMTYYVKIRGYKNFGEYKLYGSCTKIKKVKLKK